MSYYPTPGTPYVPQQPVNPYGGMGTVGLATPLPNTQMQQAQPQRPQPMNGQQPVQQSAQDGGWLLGRPVSSREEFLAIPSDLYGRWTYCPDPPRTQLLLNYSFAASRSILASSFACFTVR